MKGNLIIIVGPSASGKTELVKTLVERIPNSIRLTTTTTRNPRPGEVGEYVFVDKDEFEKGIQDGDFFEHAEVHGNLYGSSKKVLDTHLEKFKHVFAVIDVQGAKTLKTKIPEALTIFIRGGSIEDIHKRILRARRNISNEELEKRIANATHELSLAHTFDAVVDNEDGKFEKTVTRVMDILKV